jgi:sugar lactone lactonase YvrE
VKLRYGIASLAAVVVGAIAFGAAGAEPRVRLLGGPATIEVGAPWRATLVVRPADAGRPVVRLRGRSTRAASLRRLSPGRFALTAVFPSAGRWRVEARVAGKAFRLRTVVVRRPATPPIALRAPVQLAIDPAGHLLVTDNELGALIRVDPASGRATVVSEIRSPYGLAVGRDGELYATSDDRLVRLAPGAETTLARSEGGLDIGPVTVDGAGVLFFFTENRIYRVSQAGASRFGGTGAEGFGGDAGPVEQATFARAHGMAVAADGALVLADSGNGRLRRVDLSSRVVTTIVAGLGFPAGAATGPDGSLYIAEHEANAVRRVAPDGTTSVLADNLAGPMGIAVATDGTAYVTEIRPPRIRRIDATGAISTVFPRP